MRRCVSLRLKARLEPEKPSGAIAVVAKMVPTFFGSTEYGINGRRRSGRRGATVFVYSDSYFFAIGKEKELGV